MSQHQKVVTSSQIALGRPQSGMPYLSQPHSPSQPQPKAAERACLGGRARLLRPLGREWRTI